MSETLRQTPLHAAHLAMGAKMVGFAGWSMPLHYGSQLEEHHAVRREAGMFDVSHMLAVDVQGPGARGFLQRVLANDVARLSKPGKALYSCMLREDGGVLDDLLVYASGADAFRLIVNAGTAEKDLAWLEAQRSKNDERVAIAARRDLSIIAIQGPRAREKVWAARPGVRAGTERLASFEAAQVGALFVARTGYTGEDGFELLAPADEAPALWRALAEQGVKPAGLGARDTLRLEAGMNLYGQDMDENVTPLESGLAWTVDLSGEREFIGRAALQRAKPRKHAMGLVLRDKGVMRSHQRVHAASGAGEITSGGFSPTMNRSIALARVPVEAAAGAKVEIEMRDRRLEAVLVKPPFVRNGKVLTAYGLQG